MMTDTDRTLQLLAYLTVMCMAALAGVEIAGLFGGLLCGHPFLEPWKDVPGTLERLFASFGRDAWPAAEQRWLVRSMTVPLIVGVLVAVALAGVGVWVLQRVLPGWLGTGTPEGARFAQPRDLRSLYVRRPQPGRVTLGRTNGRQLIAATRYMSTLIMGPTQQSKKTSALVIPALLEWEGPAVNTSVKPDVYLATREARAQRGEVKVFDPRGRLIELGVHSATWSPIAESATWSRARATAGLLMQVGWEQDKADREPHWRKDAARFLAPLLLAAHHGNRTLEDVLRWIHTDDGDERAPIRTQPIKSLRASRDRHAREAIENLQSTWNKDWRYVGSVYSTLDANLDAWQEPSVVSATAQPDITADWLLSGQNTLYIVASERDQRLLANLVAALVMQLIADALDIAAASPELKLDPPILFALDEVANIAPIPNLAEIASMGLGPGVLLLTVLQNIAQAKERWGERAGAILAEHTCKLFCAGISDPDTLEYVRRLTGDQVIEQTSRTQHHAGSSTTVAPHHRPLAPPDAIRQSGEDRALLIAGKLPPAWITLRPWWREKTLQRVAVNDLKGSHAQAQG